MSNLRILLHKYSAICNIQNHSNVHSRTRPSRDHVPRTLLSEHFHYFLSSNGNVGNSNRSKSDSKIRSWIISCILSCTIFYVNLYYFFIYHFHVPYDTTSFHYLPMTFLATADTTKTTGFLQHLQMPLDLVLCHLQCLCQAFAGQRRIIF